MPPARKRGHRYIPAANNQYGKKVKQCRKRKPFSYRHRHNVRKAQPFKKTAELKYLEK